MYDTDGDGYFDRWEWFDVDAGEPYRVAETPGSRNISFGDDYGEDVPLLQRNVVPEATRLNRLLIATFRA